MQLVEITDTQSHIHYINPAYVVSLREYNSDSVEDGTLLVLNGGDDVTRLVTEDNIFTVRDAINHALLSGPS